MRDTAKLLPGEAIETGGLTMTETHLVQFAAITGDVHPLHMSRAFAEESVFGTRIAHGLLVLGIGNGLVNQTATSAATAILGFDWRMRRPVMIGDTVSVKVLVTDRRLTSSGDQAVVTQLREIRNQRGEVVQCGHVRLMAPRSD